MSRVAAAAALAVAVTATPAGARANGRFPNAQHVLVGPGRAGDVIVLRATFGVLVSRDAGRSFRWICEEALGYAGSWDPPIALTADGALHVGLPDGLVQTPDGCGFARNATLGSPVVADLANDLDGTTVLGAEEAGAGANRLFGSADQGRTFRRLAGLTDGWFVTVDAAPSRPRRVYATAVESGTRAPRLYRSDDGGETIARVATDFAGGDDAYLSGIDPTNADAIYVRANAGVGGALLASDDAGATLRVVGRTTGPMLGFALSDDGRRVWYGGPDDGLFRSDDAGRTFRRVADTRVTCLRYHAGALYLCADWIREPFALGRLRDGAECVEALLRFQGIAGAVECATGSPSRETCAPRFPALRATFGAGSDGGARADGGARPALPVCSPSPPDAGADAGIDAGAWRDGAADVGVARDAAGDDEGARAASCRCRVDAGAPSRRARDLPGVAWALAALVVRRRRR